MPNFDGNGPMGNGQMTGRGMGPCGRGMRRGMGSNRGFGGGQGFGRGWFQPSQDDQKKMIADYRKSLEDELAEVKKTEKEMNEN